MTSPGLLTPTLADSANASTVPAHTGMPSGSPVSAAPRSLIRPATSHGSTTRGRASPGAISSAHSSIHRRVRGSNIGTQNDADTESSVYSPVSRWTMNELAMSSCLARSHTCGSWRRSHISLGPGDWWFTVIRQRSTMASIP